MSTLRLSAATGLAALTAVLTAPAHAINVTTPASNCRPYPFETSSALAVLRFHPQATYSIDPVNTRRLVCPITRNADANGVTVWIRGSTAPGVTMSCTVYSYQFDGTLLHWIPVTAGGAPFAMPFAFNALQAPAFGHMNAVCSLPAAQRGRLYQLHTFD